MRCELSKRDPKSVGTFLREHDGVLARVVREVNSKLKTGLKNPSNKGLSLLSSNNAVDFELTKWLVIRERH